MFNLAANKGSVNRSEHLRSIPEGDPDFAAYSNRNDAESLNAAFNQSLKFERSRSYGAQAHLLDWLGFGLLTNAVARARHRRNAGIASPSRRVRRARRKTAATASEVRRTQPVDATEPEQATDLKQSTVGPAPPDD